MGGLAVGDGKVEGAEGTAAQLDRIVDGVNKGKALDVWEALEDAVPVIAGSDVAILAVEDILEL